MSTKLRLLAPAPASSDGLAPCLMSFPAGVPREASSDVGSQELRLSLLRNSAERKRHHMQLRAETDRMSYVGVSTGRSRGAAASEAHTVGELLIGVYRKGEGTVQLVRADKLFVMEGSIKAPLISLEPPADASAVDTKDLSAYYENKRKLTRELGSEKARKRQVARDAQRVHAEAVFNKNSLTTDISDALAAAAENRPAELTDVEKRPMHPTFVLGAASVREAYPRAGLVADDVWANLDLKPLLNATKSAAELERLEGLVVRDLALWPKWVLGRLSLLPPDKDERTSQLRMLISISYMMRLYGMRGSLNPQGLDDDSPLATDAKPPLHQIPLPSWHALLRAFTERGSKGVNRNVSSDNRTKLTMHVLTAALWTCQGSVGIEEMSALLKLTPQKVQLYLRQLGCAMSKTSGGLKCAVLKSPFVLPRAEKARGAAK